MDEAIEHVSKGYSGNSFQGNSHEFQLQQYIQTQLHAGYGYDAIRLALIQQGVDAQTANRLLATTISQSGQSGTASPVQINVKHEVQFSPITTGIIVLLVIGLSTGGYFFLNQSSTPLLDVAIDVVKQQYTAGDTIPFTIELRSMGAQKRFDASIRYVIIDASNKIHMSTSETIAVETTTRTDSSITLPSDLTAGTYTLKAIVDYGGKTPAESSRQFTVSAIGDVNTPSTGTAPTETPGSEASNANANNPDSRTEANASPSSTTATYLSTDPQSFGQALESIELKARSNPVVALASCAVFASPDQKDICIARVSDISNTASNCAKIAIAKYRDDCYLTFAMRASVTENYCPQISDTASREVCDQIKLINDMNYYFQMNNTEKVTELSTRFNPSIYNTNPVPATYEEYTEPVSYSVSDLMVNITLTGPDANSTILGTNGTG